MSDLAPYVVWPSSVWVDRTRRWRRVVASAAFWAIVATGAGLTVVAGVDGLPSYASAHRDLWILAALALAADLVPFRLPPPAQRTTTFLLSPCFCFSILLLYPPANGVVTQVLAIAVAAPRLHLRWPALAFLAARLVCSLTVAGWVAGALRGPTASIEHPPGVAEIGTAVPAALVFLTVTLAISFVGALLSGATRAEIMKQTRIEVIARSSVLLVGVVIVSTPTIWSHALLFVPLLGWYELSWLLKDRERRLEHDPVSGLLSRQGLASALAGLPRVHSHPTDWFELIVVELRGIAHIRLALGQEVADRLTVAASERLRGITADADRIGQLSESQLAVLRSEPSDGGDLGSACRVQTSMSEPIACDGVPYRLEPVVGVAVGPQHGRYFDVLLANAEAALVEADLHQEQAWVYTPEAKSDVDERLALLRDLGETLRDPSRASEVVVLYQPQVSVATGKVDSVEALLRWFHPDRGPIPTDRLIELVEPTGVMQELTRYVVDRVVGQLAEWNQAGLDLRATVNISVLDLFAGDFDTHLEHILETHGVPARQLDIEITERALVTETRLLDEAAQRVADLGVGLSLDDFGTGFASLQRLRQMPLAEVKIDRSYVSRIANSPADRAIVTTIHDLAKVLKLRVVAEGIEDEQTARILAELDGMIGQGWLYARAMTAEHLVDWLKNRPTEQIHPRARTSMPAQLTLPSANSNRNDQRIRDLHVAVATDFASGIVDVTARGVLDVSSARVMRSAVIKAAAEEPSRIVVNLNDTVIIDRHAVGVFIALAGQLSESPIGLALHAKPGVTADLLRRTLVGSVPVRDDRADAIAALADPGQHYRRARMHLMPVPTAPAQARALVDLACTNWGLRVDEDIAELLVSELVTNAVAHARTEMDVTVVRAGAHLIIQVSDQSTVMPIMTTDGFDAERMEGRGLAVVNATAAGWGFHATDTGKTVWASLRVADDNDREESRVEARLLVGPVSARPDESARARPRPWGASPIWTL